MEDVYNDSSYPLVVVVVVFHALIHEQSKFEMASSSAKSDGRIAKLRSELKEWEHAFAKAHDGRKPTREETKQDSAIGISSVLLFLEQG